HASAEKLLRRAQQLYPDDFWINHDLGATLASMEPPRYVEAIRFFTAALALRPRDAGVYLNYGWCLHGTSAPPGALAAFQQAIRLAPNYAEAHNNEGAILSQMDKLDAAIEASRKPLATTPASANARRNLSVVSKRAAVAHTKEGRAL